MQNKITEIAIIGKETERVWIGDPCYVIPDELWDSVCEQIFKGGGREVGFKIRFTFDQILNASISQEILQKCRVRDDSELVFLQCGTAYGDGTFDSNTGFSYGVDAGCLAIIPEYLVDHQKNAELGQWIEINSCADNSRPVIGLITDGKGEFQFTVNGNTVELIFTGDEDEDDI